MSTTDQKEQKVNVCLEYDLTQSIIPYIDRHMALPMLEHLQEKKLFPTEDLQFAKYQLVEKTSMVDYAGDEYKKLGVSDTLPASMSARKATIHSSLTSLKLACTPLLTALLGNHADEEKIDQMEDNERIIDTIKHAINMGAAAQFTAEDLSNIHEYAKLIFDCGYYKRAAVYIFIFRSLSKDEEISFQALWGSLASEILVCYSPSNLQRALDGLNFLSDAVDQRVKTSHPMQLQQRTWLIHWSLFLFFNPNQSPSSTYNGLLDFFFQDKILNTVQTSCPHILRYITVALICNIRNRRSLENDLASMLTNETWRDPFTSFVCALYHDFDMDAAHGHLKDCEALFETDFFLSLSSDSRPHNAHIVRDQFMENARRLIFEIYCKTHERIDLTLLASRLDTTPEEVGSVIIPFIRDAGLNAKIDSNANLLVMERTQTSVYQTVINKTKGLAYRSTQLTGNVEKQLQAQQ